MPRGLSAGRYNSPAIMLQAPRFLTLLWSIVVATVVATAFAMVPGSLDVFRTPKDVVFLTLSLVLLAVGATGALLSDDLGRILLRLRTPVVFLAAVAAAWTAVAAAASLRPGVSLWKPLTVVCFAVFFAAALLTARGRNLTAIMIVLIPAAINAIVAALQSTHIWAPWVVDPRIPERVRTTGLIGNPNDLGTYLVLPALAALAAGIAWPRQKWLYAFTAVLMIGIASAQSVTPLMGAVAGLFLMAMTSNTRRLRIYGMGAVLALIIVAAIHPASRARFQRLYENASSGQLPEMTSFRVVPAATALRMFLDRPLVGVGPGTFSALYMTYKERTDQAFPQWVRLGNESFAQAHNDHAQVLAETGLPGYLIFLAALALLASITLRRRGDVSDPRARFARTFALPAAAAFAVLALAQFPLQLTAPMVPAIYLAALCFAWTETDESA